MTRLIYLNAAGFAAGSYYTHKGGSVELLCLPRDPVWGNYNSASSSGDYLYGTEMKITDANSQMMFGENYNNQNVPCVVCQSVGRITSLRIPGRSSIIVSLWIRGYFSFQKCGTKIIIRKAQGVPQ